MCFAYSVIDLLVIIRHWVINVSFPSITQCTSMVQFNYVILSSAQLHSCPILTFLYIIISIHSQLIRHCMFPYSFLSICHSLRCIATHCHQFTLSIHHHETTNNYLKSLVIILVSSLIVCSAFFRICNP